ncbi:MAG: putative repeat protein (TIGR01451 family), partial [Verrucomicrobiales bacterium]
MHSVIVRCFISIIVCTGLSFGAPVVSSSQDDSFPDTNADLKADPGEQIDYKTSISNTGPDAATGVRLVSPIPTDTTQTGGVRSTPLARDDSYSSIGNVGITVLTANGLLANDFDLGGTAPTVVSPVPGTPTSTSLGGSVTITAGGLGGFTYTPPAGITGQDTFSYTIADENGAALPAPATGSNISTVTIMIGGMIWFINNGGVAGNGTLASPFNSLSQHNANPSDNDRDCIFVYTGAGNYGGGIVLQNRQILIGQGSTATLAASCGITPPANSTPLPTTSGTRPVLFNAAGNGISLASRNTVRGMNIGNSSGSGLIGSSFGTAVISEVAVSTGGVGINLNTGTLFATFDSVTKTSSDSDGIVLTSVAGNADFGAMTITSTGAGRGIRLDGTGTASSIFSGSGN